MIELLTVVAVIVGLAAISVRVFGQVRRKAQQTGCVNNLRGLGIGLENYLQDNNGKMPTLSVGRADKSSQDPVIETLLVPYVGNNAEVFHCPADVKFFKASGCSYFWNTMLNEQNRYDLKFLGESDNISQVPLLYDKEAFHPNGVGANILYADYSVTDRVSFRVEQQN